MENKNWKAWLYLLPAILFLGAFMVSALLERILKFVRLRLLARALSLALPV